MHVERGRFTIGVPVTVRTLAFATTGTPMTATATAPATPPETRRVDAPLSNPFQNLTRVRAQLTAALIEREEEIDALLVALVAREHVLLVGPPGTGKSYAARLVAQAIPDCRYVERLLSPTTPPEVLWGPVSIKALREDRYEHVTAGSVADCELAYLDEVGRASPAILDTLLHLLGPERQALIGSVQTRVPLVSAIGSANTWPEDAAMLDRWLLRRVVRPVSRQGRETLMFGGFPDVTPCATLADLAAAHTASRALPWTADAKSGLTDITDQLTADGIRPSDRRLRASVRVAQAKAALAGSDKVVRAHLETLSAVLWDRPEHEQKATEIIRNAANPMMARLTKILAEAEEAAHAAQKDPNDAATRMAAIQKLEEMTKEADKAKGTDPDPRAAKIADYIRGEAIKLKAAALGISPEKLARIT